MTPSEHIGQHIDSFTDWRAPLLSSLRRVIGSADPDLQEGWKWNTPIWEQSGNVCALGAFKDHVKVNFFQGASLADPAHLFNSGLDAKTSRSIDFHDGDQINELALQELIRAAVAHNLLK